MAKRKPLEWIEISGGYMVPDCWRCVEYMREQPLLSEAFASVGIEHGKSSWQMAESFFGQFHERGHKMEPRPG